MNKETEGDKHVVACLEQRLHSTCAACSESVGAGERKVIAYYDGMGSMIENRNGAVIIGEDCEWKVDWRDTENLRVLEDIPRRCVSHDDYEAKHNLCLQDDPVRSCHLPFCGVDGDEMVIQKLLHCACIGDEVRTTPDEFGLVDYNNFRSIIFSCKPKSDAKPIHSFLLSPFIPHEGDDLGKRIEQTVLLIKFLSKAGLDKIRVIFLKGSQASLRKQSGSAEVITRYAEILKSNVFERLKKDKDLANRVEFVPNDKTGAVDKDIDFEIERAILCADLIVAFDGSTGNLIARMLTYFNNTTELYAIPWFICHRPWPVGEGTLVGYDRKGEKDVPLKRAIMWKVLEK